MFGRGVDVEVDGNDWPGLAVLFLRGVIVEFPFLISSHNPMQKTFSLLSLNQLFASEKSPFNVSRFQFIRHPISLFLNHSHGSQSYRNGLLSYPQWFCKLLLRLTLIFLMPLIFVFEFFWLSRARLVFNAEISILEMSKLFPTWFISWSSVIINKHSMGFSRTFLPIKAENQNLPQMHG